MFKQKEKQIFKKIAANVYFYPVDNNSGSISYFNINEQDDFQSQLC